MTNEATISAKQNERAEKALEAIKWLLDNQDARECGCAYEDVNIWQELEKVAAILEG